MSILIRMILRALRSGKARRYTVHSRTVGISMNRRVMLVSILLSSAVALAACGTKGPLILPNQPASAAKKKTTPAPRPATPPAPTQPAPDNAKQQ